MKKYGLMIITGLMAAFMFTGCGRINSEALVPKTKYCNFTKHSAEDCNPEEKDLIIARGIGDSAMMRHTGYNNSTYAAMQVAAQATLLKGHKFFSIMSPHTISNKAGSTMNTAEEYVKKCSVGAGDMLAFNWDPCEIHRRGNRYAANFVIKTYAVQPVDFLTYYAEDVLAYLKANDMFDEEASVGELIVD